MTRKLTTPLLCARYSVSDRTIDRWIESGILPRPMMINGRRYWDEADIEQMERKRVSGQRRDNNAERLAVSDSVGDTGRQ
jgi:predicted DNA-binding transcriptional regulator AlpA